MGTNYFLAPVEINGSALAGIFRNRAGPAREILGRGIDGNYHITLRSARKRWAACEIGTLDLGAASAILTGSTDLPAVKLNGTTGYAGYFIKGADGLPGPAGGTVHEKRVGASGTIWCESIEWKEGGDAEMMLKGLFDSSDGTVEPLVYSQVAIPSIPSGGGAYDLTNISVNGSTLSDITSFHLRFDPGFVVKRHPGSILARGVVSGGNPIDISMEIGLEDLSIMRGAGGAGGTGAVAAVFTKRANNGGLGSATFTITLNGEWSMPGEETADEAGVASGQVIILPRYDGTNKPVTWLAA